MATEIIINSTPEETRVALKENGTVTEVYIDREKERGIAGNIYKGRVLKVLPGMQAAFVDIGFDKSAFLHVSDTFSEEDEYSRMLAEEMGEESLDMDNEFRRRRIPALPIEDLLQEGQEIIVQVSKEPIGTKGARVTTYISLPGRYLVYMPFTDHTGVSRRIADENERFRLRELVGSLKASGVGYIIRTASEGKTEEDFRGDMEFLDLLWGNIQKKREKAVAPTLIHSEIDLIFRVVRDMFTPDVSQILVDSSEDYYRLKEFVRSYLPRISPRIELYEGREPVFDACNIEIEISRALNRKVWLKSGGYIIIDQAEALTAIDVNTGRFVGKRNPEETILKTNLEAVKEIAYQLRLRNIGGIIIIDFIDMENEENRKKVFAALQDALAGDRAKTNVFQISELGLVEMTRKRIRESLGRSLCEPCSYCEGRAFNKSATTVCYEIFREISRSARGNGNDTVIVTAHPDVAGLMSEEERTGVEHLEMKLRKRIIVRSDTSFHIEHYEISHS